MYELAVCLRCVGAVNKAFLYILQKSVPDLIEHLQWLYIAI